MKKNRLFCLFSIAILALSTGCKTPDADDDSSDASKKTFTLTYNANGAVFGTVPVDTVKYAKGQKALIMDNTGSLTVTGKKFAGWNTKADGSGTALAAGDSLEINADTTVYASWAKAYRVVYDANGASGGDAPIDTAYYSGNQGATILGPGNLTLAGSAFSSWNTMANGSGSTYKMGDSVNMAGDLTLYAQWRAITSRTFNSYNFKTEATYSLNAEDLAVGERCIVYVEKGCTATTDNALAVANEFDKKICAQIVDNFGNYEDVDSNGKVILLLLDIQDGFSGSGSYTAGYFAPINMFAKTTYSDSNEADMLFVDTYPAEAASADSFQTVAHEFQHMINFSNTYLKTSTQQDVWINEGLSSGAEYVYSGTVSKSRVDWYNSDPCGTIAKGNNFFVWDGYWEKNIPSSVLDNYATVNLFFQWLRIHASNGTGIYKDILASDKRDFKAVTEAASSRISTQFASWKPLLQAWLLSNIYGNSSGYYGYKGAIATNMPCSSTSLDEMWYFSPGEAILCSLPSGSLDSGKTAGSGANVTYLGLSVDGTIDDSSPFTGVRTLVYNANSDIAGSDEKGYVASGGMAGTSGVFARQVVAENPFPVSWAVDVHFNEDGTVDETTRRALSGDGSRYGNGKTAKVAQ